MSNDNSPPKENIGARIPADWVAKLKDLADALNCTQTELITEAIGEYLDKDVSTIVDRLTALERQVAHGHGDEPVNNSKIDASSEATLAQLVEMNQTVITQNAELNNQVTHITNQNTKLNNQISNIAYQNAELKNQVTSLTNQIASLARKLNNLTEAISLLKQQPATERVTLVESVSADKFVGGITQTELCERFRISPGSVAGMAKREGLSPQDYLAKMTRWRYRVRPGQTRGRWHPPEQ